MFGVNRNDPDDRGAGWLIGPGLREVKFDCVPLPRFVVATGVKLDPLDEVESGWFIPGKR